MDPKREMESDELNRSDEDMRARERNDDEEFEQLDDNDVTEDEVEEG